MTEAIVTDYWNAQKQISSKIDAFHPSMMSIVQMPGGDFVYLYHPLENYDLAPVRVFTDSHSFHQDGPHLDIPPGSRLVVCNTNKALILICHLDSAGNTPNFMGIICTEEMPF